MAEKNPEANDLSSPEIELSVLLSPSPQIKQHAAGNLTGDLRKVKDMAADMHNLISKWDSLNLQGMNILTEMANILIDKVFINQDEEQNVPKVIPLKLEPLCDSLQQVVDSMEYIVNKMSLKVTLAEGLVSLQQFKKAQPMSRVLFLTMTLEDVASTVRAIREDYRKEAKLKREIYKNIVHSCDRETAMFYLASWMHQPYVHTQTSNLLQALIKDTGHVK